MRLIEKGNPQKGWTKRYRCTGKGNGDGGCKALLDVSADDLFETTSSCMGEVDYYITFACPECGVWTDIDDAPGSVWDLVRRSGRKPPRRP